MALKDYGSGVSGYLDPEGRNFETTVYQASKPVLDTELNLIQDVRDNVRRKTIRRILPSGWLADEYLSASSPTAGLFTANVTSDALEIPSLTVHVNGWIFDVVNTNDNGANVLDLGAAPSGAGVKRFDLVILEVWRRSLAASPSTDGKSPSGRIWRYGNVKVDAADDLTLNYVDDILDGNVGSETTQRVQIQYRLRVINDVDLFTYLRGIEDTSVVAHTVPASAAAPDGVATAYTFSSMSSAGDPGLWRAGDGNPANGLGTVDGYVYALPLVAVSRRNDTAFDRNTNHNGGSGRPDGYTHDIIEPEDLIDLRNGVSLTGWNYQEVLEKNLNWLCDNALRTEIGSTSVGGGVEGATLLRAVEIGLSNGNGGDGVTTGDTPGADFIGQFDGVRRTFSDEPIIETVWVRYTPTDLGYPGGWPATDFSTTIAPSSLQIYQHATLNWAAFAPAGVTILDVEHAVVQAEGGGVSLSTRYVRTQTTGTGQIPQGSLSVRIPEGIHANAAGSPLYLKLVVLYPSGLGMPVSNTADFGASSLSWNNPGSLPASYASDETFVIDPAHRAVQYDYLTTDVVKVFTTAASDEMGLVSTTDVLLYERAESVSAVTINGGPYGGTITILPDQQAIRLDPGSLTAYDDVQVTYKAVRPMQQTGVQATVYYETVPAQASRDAIAGTSVRVIPRYVSPHLYVLTGGPGSEGEPYPFPVQTAQTGGVYPSSGGTYDGDHRFRSGPAIRLNDFEADSGFARIPSYVPVVSNPESLEFTRILGDIDIEGRSFYKEVPAGYVPSAFGSPLVNAAPHRVVQPILAELAEDGTLGTKGTLVLVTIQETSVGHENRVGFDSSLATNLTSASVYRIKGNLLNGRVA